MNRIQDLQAAIRALEEAASAQLDGHPGAWDRWYTDHGCKPARLEFPLGELFNERIRGSVWAWAMTGAVTTANLTKSDGFNAQGLEGKAVIETDLAGALLVARDLPKHRVAVYV